MSQDRKPRAFISCSLREEDSHFVDFIIKMTRSFGFFPCGTVGKFEAAPQPIWSQMKNGIKNTDCIILAATPRYIQKDIHNRNRTGQGLSEMLHIEVGMAVSSDRPIMAFVKKGTDVGSFLPNLVQYIVIDPDNPKDIQAKWPLIANYFRSALIMIQQRWQRENKEGIVKVAGGVLACIGGAAIAKSVFEDFSDCDEEDEWE